MDSGWSDEDSESQLPRASKRARRSSQEYNTSTAPAAASRTSRRAAGSSAAAPDAVKAPTIGDRVLVEVNERGRTAWRHGKVVEARRGRFTVVLAGRNESADTFRESYTMEDHGSEWKWPTQGSRRDEDEEVAEEEMEEEAEEDFDDGAQQQPRLPPQRNAAAAEDQRQRKLQRELLSLHNYDRSGSSRSRRAANNQVAAACAGAAAEGGGGRRGRGADAGADGDGEDSGGEAALGAAAAADEGEEEGEGVRGGLRLRPRNSVSYREPSMLETRRPRSPSPPRLPRVGDDIEVEVEADGLVSWQPAEVREIVSKTKFSVCINCDEDFIEVFGLDDEGREWRRHGRWDGLQKRERRAVERWAPEPGGRGKNFPDDRASRVGPFYASGPRDRGDGEGHAGDGGRRRRRRSGGGGHGWSRAGRARGSESSTMDSEEDFQARKQASTNRMRSSIQPILGGGGWTPSHGGGGGSSPHGLQSTPHRELSRDNSGGGEGGDPLLAGGGGDAGAAGEGRGSEGDVAPLAVDASVGWDKVGGLEGHVAALKEMVLMPLLYPEAFTALGVAAPKGVLFHGPPGTGKTLVARAVANTCSVGGRHVSFFMRKGADVLSKWVGEAEKQLRLLFQEASRLQPSIIFFDEIDGLAPMRSSKQDYIHASIVSTLLALVCQSVGSSHKQDPQSIFLFLTRPFLRPDTIGTDGWPRQPRAGSADRRH